MGEGGRKGGRGEGGGGKEVADDGKDNKTRDKP